VDIADRVVTLYGTLWWSLWKRLFFSQFKSLAKNGAWRGATLAALAIRKTDTVLEIPVTTPETSVPLLTNFPDIDYGVLSSRIDHLGGKHISYVNDRLGCSGGRYDKVVCCLALHPLMPLRKIALLKELRRVLRQRGTLYVVDFDKPLSRIETLALRCSGSIFGQESADIHHEGTMGKQLELVGFSGIKRVYCEGDILGRISIFRAHR
jgi:hypothetical protein